MEISVTEHFNCIYNDTYHSTLRFIICKCHNINDTNDILQETYLELYKLLKKKEIIDTNLEVYLIRIASYKIKKHYSLLQRTRYKRLLSKLDKEDILDTVEDTVDIEEIISNESFCQQIWQYVKTKHGMIPKVFYLRFREELSIKEISKELEISESQVKNHLYRVLKEIKNKFGEDEEE